jgi:CheY-like chemotaxis protein
MPQRVLVVDDDAEVATMLARALLRHGFTIETIAEGAAALARAGEAGFDAALLDLVMPGQDGMALALALRAKLPELRIALLTGYKHSPLLEAAAKQRMAVFLKPVVIAEIVGFLQQQDTR